MNWQGILALVAALALVAVAASFGARFRPGDWYETLAKPAWTPPNRLFAPVWTLLYLMMAIAAWWVWERGRGTMLAVALGLWTLQLAANAAWSWLFFGRRRIGWAFADILLLWLLIAAATAAFFRVAAAAGLLMLPYLVWTGFAGALNFAVWRRNRHRDLSA